MEKRSFLDRLTRDMLEKDPPRTEPTSSPHPSDEKKPQHDTDQCALDVYQTSDGIVIRALIAGVRPEDLDISITNGVLTIRGVRVEETTVPSEDYYYRECYFGPFSRSMILPEGHQEGDVSATVKDGVLTIRIPNAKKTTIAIHAH